jgi:hypothetical protein
MPPKIKHTYTAPKRAQPTKAAQGLSSCKRQVCDDSKSDNVTKRSQKRQKQKGKGRKPIPVLEETVDEHSSKESDGPEAIELFTSSEPGNNTEHECLEVCS